MSLAGVSGAALAQQAATYRPALMSASMLILGGTLWTVFRREGGLFNKVLAASATIIGFVFSLRLIGVF